MTIFNRTISRAMMLAIGAFLLIGAVGLLLSNCAKQRNAASQARTDTAQAGAAQNSAADAIATVSKAGEAQAASEALTRDNEQSIRAADGAAVKVNPAVNNAGLIALCRRESYRDAPRCAPFRK